MNLATECANKCPVLVLEASIKRSQHKCVRYEVELIYIQLRMKGQCSLELALENKKETKKNDILQFSTHQLVQTRTIIVMKLDDFQQHIIFLNQ